MYTFPVEVCLQILTRPNEPSPRSVITSRSSHLILCAAVDSSRRLISRAISSCSGPSSDSNWSFLSVMSTTFGSPATTVAEIGSSVSSARSPKNSAWAVQPVCVRERAGACVSARGWGCLSACASVATHSSPRITFTEPVLTK